MASAAAVFDSITSSKDWVWLKSPASVMQGLSELFQDETHLEALNVGRKYSLWCLANHHQARHLTMLVDTKKTRHLTMFVDTKKI
jgi:hypothetical protein